ncbi:MAG: BACON domain-containing protein [Candidatus Zixiibacteriota bacterium]|nr:MAG: BACON domain-containing protein [candidate division Zixibacteria bacterium]
MRVAISISLGVFLLALVVTLACSEGTGPDSTITTVQKQIAVEPNTEVSSQPPLIGHYVGRYHYITDYGASGQVTHVYLITWRFAGKNYWMNNAGSLGPFICEPRGTYVLDGTVEFIEKDDGCDEFGADPDLNPTGVFSIRQPMDSVIMTQIDGDICKEILLVPEPNEDPLLQVTPTSLDFGYHSDALPLEIENVGGKTLSWSVDKDADWMTVGPLSGTTTDEIDEIAVLVDREGMLPGTYYGQITISSNGGTEVVPVSVSGGTITTIGEYEGIYSFSTGFGTPGQVTMEFPIVWRFSDLYYWMWNAAGSEELCEPAGIYVLALGMELTQLNPGCSGTSGEPERNPTGMFSLRMPLDSIVMKQISNDTCKEIRLVPRESR